MNVSYWDENAFSLNANTRNLSSKIPKAYICHFSIVCRAWEEVDGVGTLTKRLKPENRITYPCDGSAFVDLNAVDSTARATTVDNNVQHVKAMALEEGHEWKAKGTGNS